MKNAKPSTVTAPSRAILPRPRCPRSSLGSWSTDVKPVVPGSPSGVGSADWSAISCCSSFMYSLSRRSRPSSSIAWRRFVISLKLRGGRADAQNVREDPLRSRGLSVDVGLQHVHHLGEPVGIPKQAVTDKLPLAIVTAWAARGDVPQRVPAAPGERLEVIKPGTRR